MGKLTEAKKLNDKKWKRRFGEKMRVIMKTKKITQTELGRKTKIAQPQISAYVNGYYLPDVRNAIKIALALEIDFMDLFGFMESEAYPSYLA